MIYILEKYGKMSQIALQTGPKMLDDRIVQFIRQFEGCRLAAYLDSAGVWTVGYGETGSHVGPRTKVTQEEAEVFLARSARKANDCVRRFVEPVLSDFQLAALTSLVFNIGCGAFRKSTLLQKMNAGDFNGASLEFPRWTKAGGKSLPGLVKRRAAEQHLFTEGW